MSVYRNLTDTELFLALQDENQKAFEEIYARFSSLLFRHAMGMLRDQDQASDVIQDVFILLWEKRSTICIQHSFRGYLYSMTRRRVLETLVKEKKTHEMVERIQIASSNSQYYIDEEEIEEELIRKIEIEIEKLPGKMREIFKKSRSGNFSYQQISDQLHIAPNTVRKQVSNALKIIRTNVRVLFSIF